jgi:hypothetical protein
MAVPSTFADLSTTPASNSGLISDSTNVNEIDNHVRALQAFVASISQNTGNGWTSPYLTVANPSYTGTLTGGTGVVNLGGGQLYKDGSGNVGIGTASIPAGRRLVVAGGAVRFDNDAQLEWGGSSAGAYGNSASNYVVIFTNTAERLRIDANGNVAIANTGSAPATPASGGVLYVEAGALKFIGGSGTVTILAPA